MAETKKIRFKDGKFAGETMTIGADADSIAAAEALGAFEDANAAPKEPPAESPDKPKARTRRAKS